MYPCLQQLNSKMSPDQSFSRCFSPACCNSDAFGVRPKTPGSLNDCPVLPGDVVINEIHVDDMSAGYPDQFIELFDGGRGNTSLQYLTLVFFNGQARDLAYFAIDLSGYRTNRDGYLLIGTSKTQGKINLYLYPLAIWRSINPVIIIFLENAFNLYLVCIHFNIQYVLLCSFAKNLNTAMVLVGSNTRGELLPTGSHAIALYRAPAGAFPRLGIEATPVSLIDVLVYTTEQVVDEISLIQKLLPGIIYI